MKPHPYFSTIQMLGFIGIIDPQTQHLELFPFHPFLFNVFV